MSLKVRRNFLTKKEYNTAWAHKLIKPNLSEGLILVLTLERNRFDSFIKRV